MFLNKSGLRSLKYLCDKGMLPYVIPTLDINLNLLLQQHPLLWRFWQNKMIEFSFNPENVTSYHVISLLLLMPLLQKMPQQPDVAFNKCIDDFIGSFNLSILLEEDKECVRRALSSVMLCKSSDENTKKIVLGLYGQYELFVNNTHANIMPDPNYLPGFRGGRNLGGYPLVKSGGYHPVTSSKIERAPKF